MQQPRAELVLQRRIPVPAEVAVVASLETQLCITQKAKAKRNRVVREPNRTLAGRQ